MTTTKLTMDSDYVFGRNFGKVVNKEGVSYYVTRYVLRKLDYFTTKHYNNGYNYSVIFGLHYSYSKSYELYIMSMKNKVLFFKK